MSHRREPACNRSTGLRIDDRETVVRQFGEHFPPGADRIEVHVLFPVLAAEEDAHAGPVVPREETERLDRSTSATFRVRLRPMTLTVTAPFSMTIFPRGQDPCRKPIAAPPRRE